MKKNVSSEELLQLSLEHFILTLIPVLLAILFGLPMAYFASQQPGLQRTFGTVSTVVQTIPGLALLTFLIPLTGIGTKSAIIVLFLYALLPIFINAVQGFQSLTPLLELSCQSLQMTSWQKLYWVQIRLALPLILSGIQTSFVMTVGNATLAALIGAGGYGKKIIAGLAVNDMHTVLIGAIPSALMAFLFYIFFEVLIQKSRWNRIEKSATTKNR